MLRPVADVLKKLIPVSIRSPLIEGGELKASEGREEGIGFTAVYDACVLYPAPLRDLLMHLAMTDRFQAKWSDMIHDEWTGNLLKNRSDITAQQLATTRANMNARVACAGDGFRGTDSLTHAVRSR